MTADSEVDEVGAAKDDVHASLVEWMRCFADGRSRVRGNYEHGE